MDLRSDITSLVRFEAATAMNYPWAMPAEVIISQHLNTVCQKVEELSVDGTWDSNLIYETVSAVCGSNPEIK